MIEESDLLSLADFAVKKAMSKGADQAEVWVEQAIETSVTLERNDVSSGSSNQFSGMGIRVIKERGMGFASLNLLSPKLIERAASDAVAIARYAAPIEHNALPEKQPLTRVETFDPKSSLFGVEDALAMSSELLKVAKDHDNRVMVDYGMFTATIGMEAICSSEGIEAEEKSSIFIWQLLGMAREGPKIGSYAASFDATIRVRDINVQNTAEDFARKAIDSLGAKPIDSFAGSMIMTPLAAAGFIMSPLVSSASADNLQKGRSQFAGREGTQVVSECINLRDDGTIPRAIGSGTFDREGSPHTPLKIITDGKFVSPLSNFFAASREEKETSGHAVGSYRTVPGIGPTNLILEGTGDKVQKVDQVIGNMKKGIIVTRFSGDIDPISGFFSGLVKGGFYVANGEICHPVASVTIQGNIFESMNSIGAISQELKRVGSWTLPELLEFEQIQFISR